MTTPISIIPDGDHGNVASSSLYQGGQVALADQLKGEPLDCEEFSLLRLELNVSHPTNSRGFDNDARLHVTLEHSANGAVWSELERFTPMGAGGQRKAIGAFERYVRASWWIHRQGADPQSIFSEGVAISWALTGVAVEAGA